ncbi:MAG: nuclear transport factor 2 family protein [Ilumatobacter sp.]|nr:nuclear transport factor 2 family protein [Ilumatobacter sp.]
MLSDLERLIAIEEIKNLKARYFRSMDTGDWDALGTVFTADAVFDFSEATVDPVDNPDADGPEPVVGGDAIVAAIRDAVSTANTVHHGHMPEIEITSATTATAIWPMQDFIRRLTVDADLPFSSSGFTGFGHYHETYLKIDGQWRIQASKLTRLRVTLD